MSFGASEFRLLLRQHLELPVLEESAVGSACPVCGEALDLFGDHLVSCWHAGAWLRHNILRPTVGRIATAAGFSFKYEDPLESLGMSSSRHGREVKAWPWTLPASMP